MSNYLSTIGDFDAFAANLAAARNEVGSGPGAGDTYLKVDKQTGTLTFGKDNQELPPGHRFVVGLHEITHGYIVSSGPGGTMLERKMAPMAHGPRPVPPGGKYGTYEGGGPRNATEIALSSIDEPGFKLTFTAWGPSNANRIGNLLDTALLHMRSPDGQRGFVHPVVAVRSGSYKHKTYGTIHHIDFDVVDWLSKDGKTLLSQAGGAVAPPDDEDPAPWDDVTDDEHDLLRA